MAKSNSFFGNRRGSTKHHVFYEYDGQQITREKAEHVKNPRSMAQAQQRGKMNTLVHMYSLMKEICNHSFEDVPYGGKSMRHFLKINSNRKVNVMDKEKKNFVPSNVIVAQGSLGNPITNDIEDGVPFDLTDGTESFFKSLGLSKNGYITFCFFDRLQQFCWVRLSFKEEVTEKKITNEVIKKAFRIEYNRLPMFDKQTTEILFSERKNGWSFVGSFCSGCIILSDYQDKKWKRSNAEIDLNFKDMDKFDSYKNILTYSNLGNSPILNGGHKVVVGGGANIPTPGGAGGTGANPEPEHP